VSWTVVLETLRALAMEEAIGETVRVRQRVSGYSEVENVEALGLVLDAGGTCLDDIKLLKADFGLALLLREGIATWIARGAACSVPAGPPAPGVIAAPGTRGTRGPLASAPAI